MKGKRQQGQYHQRRDNMGYAGKDMRLDQPFQQIAPSITNQPVNRINHDRPQYPSYHNSDYKNQNTIYNTVPHRRRLARDPQQ